MSTLQRKYWDSDCWETIFLFPELLESKQNLFLPEKAVGPDKPRPQQSKKSLSWASMKGCLPLRLQCILSLETQGEVVSQTHLPFFFFFLNHREIAHDSENSWEAKIEATINPEPSRNFIDLYYLLKTNTIFVYCMKIWKYWICREKKAEVINVCHSLGDICVFF